MRFPVLATSGRDLLTSGGVSDYPDPSSPEAVGRQGGGRRDGERFPAVVLCVRKGVRMGLMFIVHPASGVIPPGGDFVQRLLACALPENHITKTFVTGMPRILPPVRVAASVSIYTGVGVAAERTSI